VLRREVLFSVYRCQVAERSTVTVVKAACPGFFIEGHFRSVTFLANVMLYDQRRQVLVQGRWASKRQAIFWGENAGIRLMVATQACKIRNCRHAATGWCGE